MAEYIPAGAKEARMSWYELADTPAWTHWLTTHVEPLGLFSVVYFEDRADSSIRVRRDELSYYVSADSLAAAAKTGTLEQFMQQIFLDVYLKWTENRDLPPPPTDTTVANP